MDNLLDALQKGTAFNVRDGGRRRTPRTTGGMSTEYNASISSHIISRWISTFYLSIAERRAQLQKSRSRSQMNNGGELSTREIDGSLITSETPRRPERRKKTRPGKRR